MSTKISPLSPPDSVPWSSILRSGNEKFSEIKVDGEGITFARALPRDAGKLWRLYKEGFLADEQISR